MTKNMFLNLILFLIISCVKNETEAIHDVKDFVKIEIDNSKSNNKRIRANLFIDNQYFNKSFSEARSIELYYTDIPPKSKKYTFETIKAVNHDFSVDLEKMIGEKFPILINFNENEKKKIIYFVIKDEYLKIDTIKNHYFNVKDEMFFTAEFNIKSKTIYLK